MNVLIVYAHPEPKSFSGSLRDAAAQVLTDAGHQVVQSDLYLMGFNPVPGWHDFVNHDRQEYFGYATEQKRATEANSFAPDLQSEMDKVAACDLLLFVFPLWWYGMPAIMKGWIDRVFAAGFAYGGGRWFDRGVFCEKRAMLILTVGGPETAYAPNGLQGDMAEILFPIHRGILAYTGFCVHEPFVAYTADAETRPAILDDFRERLANIEDHPTLETPRLAEYDRNLRRVI